MNRIRLLSLLFLFIVSLTACSGNEELSQDMGGNDKGLDQLDTGEQWIKYSKAQWEENYKGLSIRVNFISVSNEAPSWDNSQKKVPSIKISLTMQNTSDKSIFSSTAYQSGIETSSGEDLASSLTVSDEFGYIHPGETIDGEIVFFPEITGDVEEIEWITWYFIANQLDLNYKHIEQPKGEYQVKLLLK
jgi:hypothetical protein